MLIKRSIEREEFLKQERTFLFEKRKENIYSEKNLLELVNYPRARFCKLCLFKVDGMQQLIVHVKQEHSDYPKRADEDMHVKSHTEIPSEQNWWHPEAWRVMFDVNLKLQIDLTNFQPTISDLNDRTMLRAILQQSKHVFCRLCLYPGRT
jgi:hypothetical protein